MANKGRSIKEDGPIMVSTKALRCKEVVHDALQWIADLNVLRLTLE